MNRNEVMLDILLTDLLAIAPLKISKELATLHKVLLVHGTKTAAIIEAFSTHLCAKLVITSVLFLSLSACI